MTYKQLAGCGAGPCPAVYAEDCGVGACPAVHETTGSDLLVVGKKLTVIPEELKGKIAGDEEAVKIPRSVLLEAAARLK